MSPIDFEGSGRGKMPCKGGQQSSGDMTKEKTALYLSDFTYVDTVGNTVTPTCGCDPDRVVGHRCRRCKSGRADGKYIMA